uniref:Uncharacterized protein n=1 Tax=viral metagenome TaxID=1070528 RepID=A0A6C0AF91_9ZZZZ
MKTIKCNNCLLDKKPYEFVLRSLDISDICRKCHHKKQNINDEDYEHYIIIYRQIIQIQELNIGLYEKYEQTLDEPREEGRVSSQEMLNFCEESLEQFNQMIRILEHEMEDKKNWYKLINEYR